LIVSNETMLDELVKCDRQTPELMGNQCNLTVTGGLIDIVSVSVTVIVSVSVSVGVRIIVSV